MNLFRQLAYVAGQWIDGAETLTVTNPATGEVVGTVPSLGASETRQAIKKAAEVQGAWAARTAKDRAEVLRRWFELMTEHSEALARLMTTEQVSPWPRPGARSPTRPALLNGLPKKPNAPMGTPSQRTKPMLGLS